MAKGADFERAICKELSLWWTEGANDCVFWRTSGSGARATMRRKSGKETANQEGDICATDPIGQPLIDMVTIELKKGYNSWNIKELLDMKKKNKMLEQFWSQCIREKTHRQCSGWMLITRQDRKEKLIFFDEGFFRIWRKSHECDLNYIRISWNGQLIYCFHFEDFLSKTNPRVLMGSCLH